MQPAEHRLGDDRGGRPGGERPPDRGLSRMVSVNRAVSSLTLIPSPMPSPSFPLPQGEREASRSALARGLIHSGRGRRAVAAFGRRFIGRDNGAGRALIEAPVRAVAVVITHELIEQPLQVPLVEDKHMIQALPSQCAHQPLGNRVGLGCTNQRANLRDAEAAPPAREFTPVEIAVLGV
ncbi:MAG: hypothetical protein A2151_01865 [Candidatus Muproteobacteria bacterium RBG_16_65_34]|uniref:Uncharacterized protein n=1 Tax=Candidatus Muproteobacteria bacterium RBG_16_65_34 TaxID=1817760 RepID=A0A1F6TSU0_9PROT|nr:MAG: hypothetical protein A2151_01865 [Candidatus Muproteobacteria bacterium RBG_16_65_34]